MHVCRVFVNSGHDQQQAVHREPVADGQRGVAAGPAEGQVRQPARVRAGQAGRVRLRRVRRPDGRGEGHRVAQR